MVFLLYMYAALVRDRSRSAAETKVVASKYCTCINKMQTENNILHLVTLHYFNLIRNTVVQKLEDKVRGELSKMF